jgi:hypothetical protein
MGARLLDLGGEDDHAWVEAEMEDGGSDVILFDFHLVGTFPKRLILRNGGSI